MDYGNWFNIYLKKYLTNEANDIKFKAILAYFGNKILIFLQVLPNIAITQTKHGEKI